MSDSQTPEPRTLRSSVRNVRRRPRQSDGDSIKTAPRRKRSKIAEDTYAPPREDVEEEEVNGTIEVASTMNGDLHQPSAMGRGRGNRRTESVSMLDMEIPLRGKKASLKRPTRGDGATVLTQTERYSAKLLPSTPKELRKEGVEFRGSLGGQHHALAITKERAYIWDYTSHAPVSNARTFDIPFRSKATDALPFGALVPAGNSMDSGLMVLSATSGDVVYYESIERAASLSLFQERRPGVDGSIGSLFSGEVVTELISADHAGFIVMLSSGRLIHLTLRDAQGKARVLGQFLRATEPSAGGIFGSLKGILGSGGWRRDVTSVHTRSLGPRGPIQAISITERAELQTWELGWASQSTFNSTIDCREVITEELKRLAPPESQGRAEEFVALDFAVLENTVTGREIKSAGVEVPLDLLILVRAGAVSDGSYALVDLAINGERATVNRVLELDSSGHRSIQSEHKPPRLVVPKPQRAALTVFENAIAISELDEPGPEAQLHLSSVESNSFADTIYLKQHAGHAVLNATAEEQSSHHPSGIVFVQGAGLVRIAVADASRITRLASTPIKTKVEQAVFRGALQDGNILDFSRPADERYSPEEAEQAALHISHDILTSQSPYIESDPTSIEAHLAKRSQALKALVTHVLQNYPTLSKSVMWQLLWDAEKITAGQHLWRVFENYKTVNSEKRQKRAATLMDEVCALAWRDSVDEPDLPSNEDVVRSYFIHRLRHVDKLFIFGSAFVKALKDDTDFAPLAKMRLILEADDMWTQALEAIFTFRVEHAAAYGILPELLQEGILTDEVEYVDLPAFWTSSKAMLEAAQDICQFSRKLANKLYETNDDDDLGVLAQQVAGENPRLIQLMCLIYQEHINWHLAQEDEHLREDGETAQRAYHHKRAKQIRGLIKVAQAQAGMKLAEKYNDMVTLTAMVIGEMQFCDEELAKNPADKSAIIEHAERTTARIGRYFARFGDEWANAYFDTVLTGPLDGEMFRDSQERWREPLTRYLRADSSRNKLCWINDVALDRDFAHATDALVQVAQQQETKLWAKKVELSMSKLALLATEEGMEEKGQQMADRDANVAMLHSDLEIVEIQNEIYQTLEPETTGCIDHEAALEVTMQRVGLRNQDLHSLKQLLEAGLDRLLLTYALTAEELIDVLTLMDSITEGGVDDLGGREFYLALRVLNAAAPSMPPERVETLLQLIWKRCYIYDDWIAKNSAWKKGTSPVLKDTAPFRTLLFAYENSLFDRADSHVRHIIPSDCLGAGCNADDFAYRWSDPDMLDAIVSDNRILDEQLQGYVTDRRLDGWIEMCVQGAKEVLEELAAAKAQASQAEREFAAADERRLERENGTGNGKQANGHAKGPVGIKLEDEDDGARFGVQGNADADVDMG